MAVLVEAISVLARRDAISRKYSGGHSAFLQSVPNSTFCSDEEIVRIGFLQPADVERYVSILTSNGLTFFQEGKAIDIAVADQQRGLTSHCDWLEFGRLSLPGVGGKVSACWFFDGPRIGAGLHMRGTSMSLVTPVGWRYEGSLSQQFKFVPNDRLQ
jgi:hypothetical protein